MITYKRERKKLIIPNGFECCGGSSSDCSAEVARAYMSGYTAGLSDCPDCPSGSSCNLEAKSFPLNDGFTPTFVEPSSGYDGLTKVYVYDNGYGQSRYDNGYSAGYSAGQADCPSCDCSEDKAEAYASGQTEGYGRGYDQGYLDGMDNCGACDCTEVQEIAYQSGYTAGLADCPACDCSQEKAEAYQSGYTAGLADCPTCDCSQEKETAYSSGYTNGYNSGYTDGLADCPTCDCSQAKAEAYQSGQTEGYGRGVTAGVAQQKALLTSTAFTENGTYTRADGWNSVTVNTPSNLIGSRYYLDSGFTGMATITPTHPYNGFTQYKIFDNGYGDSKYQSGYTAGVAASCTGCQSAITEAYSSGVTAGEEEAKGSIFSLEVIYTAHTTAWTTQYEYHTPVFIIDASGNSHQFIYKYSDNPEMYRWNQEADDDRQGNYTITDQWAGYLQDGAKYFQPYKVQIPMLDHNLYNTNLEGLTIKFNGEVIHNYNIMPPYDYWEFGEGAWEFPVLATEISNTYYDHTQGGHRMVTFYLQGQLPE